MSKIVVKVGLSLESNFQQGTITLTYTNWGQVGGQGNRAPPSKADNN